MDRREREAILREHGVGVDDPRDRRLRDRLQQDLDGSPVQGKPLPTRRRNFRPAVDGYIVSLGGPTAYMRRLRDIELETEAHLRRLRGRWHLAALETDDAGAFAARWTREVARWSFHAVNALIERHNRFYPVEARLPMDPRRGDYALVNGRPYRREPLTAGWALDLYPPDRTAALADPADRPHDPGPPPDGAPAL